MCIRDRVKPANRIQPECLVFRREAIQHCGPAFGVAHGADHVHRLIEHEVGVGLRGRQHAAIHGNALKGQYLTSGVGLRLAVHTDAPGKNKLICLTARAKTRCGYGLVKAYACLLYTSRCV